MPYGIFGHFVVLPFAIPNKTIPITNNNKLIHPVFLSFSCLLGDSALYERIFVHRNVPLIPYHDGRVFLLSA